MAPLTVAYSVVRSRGRRAVALAAAVAAGAACNDPVINNAATLQVASGSLVVTALTGTAPNARSALQLRLVPTVASPETLSDNDFHVVLDINAAGRPVVYPGVLVSRAAARRASIRRVTAPYDSLTRAPTDGYSADSALVVAPGEVVGVQLAGSGGGECAFTGRPYFYSKIVVDSVRLRDRLLFVRATTNPNCGFRSFAPGVPRD
jgi:hypothetical protein